MESNSLQSDQLCRVCLKESDYMKNLLETSIGYENENISLIEVLNSFLINAVVKEDDRPLAVCFDCYTNAIVAYHFKRLCNNSHNKLINYRETINNVQIKKEPIEIKEEVHFVATDDDLIREFKNETENSEGSSQSSDYKENECNENTIDESKSETKAMGEIKDTIELDEVRVNFPCEACDKVFEIKEMLRTHCKDNHNIGRPKIKKMQYCTICDKGFKKFSVLQLHYRTHTGERPYLCSICGQSFSSSPTLRSHFLAVHERKMHTCEICNKILSSWACLKRHRNTHTDKRPYECKRCDASFCRSYELKMHEKHHTGDKSYICKICGQGYVSEYRLKVHGRTHLPVKPHSCDKCDRAFTSAPLLKYHVKKKHS